MQLTITVHVNPNSIPIMSRIVEQGADDAIGEIDPQMLIRAQTTLEDIIQQIQERIAHG